MGCTGSKPTTTLPPSWGDIQVSNESLQTPSVSQSKELNSCKEWGSHKSTKKRERAIDITVMELPPKLKEEKKVPPPPANNDKSTKKSPANIRPSPKLQQQQPQPKEAVTPLTSVERSKSNGSTRSNGKKKLKGSFEDFYDEGESLGYGAFATVFVGISKENGEKFAVKKIDRSKMFWGDRDALHDEIDNLKLVCDGPHITKLYQEFCKTDVCYLVMELMGGGELFDRIIEKRTFTEKQARDVTHCMLDALRYMHQKRVAHRDLKPENLLLPARSETDVKLADFGFAKEVKTLNGCRTLCGTPGYLAPEILERWPAYDTKCDIWSVGVILFLLLGGYLPFEDKDEDKVFDRTRNGLFEFHPYYFGRVSNGAKELVTLLLTINPSKRYSAQRAMEHKWMTQGDEDLSGKQLNSEKLKMTMHAKEKMKKVIKTVVVANRLIELKEGFTQYLEKRQAIQPRFSVHYGQQQSSLANRRDDSEEGKPFTHFYDVGDLLGEGGFASVYQVKHKFTKEIFAVKEVHFTQLEPAALGALEDEISALKLLCGGPHIVRLHDVFKDSQCVHMVMEEMKGGELLQRVVEKEVYTEREARQTCKVLFDAIDYCHKKRIAHRDIKPENILLVNKDDDTSIKIADFGFSKKVTKRRCLSTLCGTAAYVAPEVLNLNIKGYDERADMWSIGVVTYILLGGYAPFEGPTNKLAALILRGDYEFDPDYWGHISNNAKGLISSLLTVNPDKRSTAEEALQSDWMTAEEETLTVNDLSIAQEKIRDALPCERLRGAVKTIIATNKLTSLGDSFTSVITGGSNPSRTIAGEVLQMSAKVLHFSQKDLFEGSESGKTFRELYIIGKELGKGDFSTIYEAQHKQSKVDYAIKCVPRKDLHPSDAVALQDEITALRILKDCVYVVNLYDVFDEPNTSYVVLEHTHGGDLIDRIIEKAHYREEDAREVCKNLLEGVMHCHKRKIANRNLKPENLLLVSRESDTDIKISDFGYAKKVLYPNSLRTQCGTEGYVAPEIISHKPAYDVKCDMWSLGVILYIVLGGYRPFRGDPDEVMRKIRYGEYDFDEKYWEHVSEEAKHLICSLLTVDPEARISAVHALRSPWINADACDLGGSLTANQEKLKTFKGKDKLRQVVKMVLAANKLQSLGSKYRAFKDF